MPNTVPAFDADFPEFGNSTYVSNIGEHNNYRSVCFHQPSIITELEKTVCVFS